MPAAARRHALTAEENGLLATMLGDGIDVLRALSLLRRRRQAEGGEVEGVELPRDRVVGADGLTPLRRRVLAAILSAPGGLPRRALAERLGVSPLTVLSAARALRERGLVQVHGNRNAARWYPAGVTPAEQPAAMPVARSYSVRPLNAAEEAILALVRAAGSAGIRRRQLSLRAGLAQLAVRDALSTLRRRGLAQRPPGTHGVWIAAGIAYAGVAPKAKAAQGAGRRERSARPANLPRSPWFAQRAHPIPETRAPARAAASAAVEAFLARGGSITVCPPAAVAPVNNGAGFARATGANDAYAAPIHASEMSQRRQDSLRRRGFSIHANRKPREGA